MTVCDELKEIRDAILLLAATTCEQRKTLGTKCNENPPSLNECYDCVKRVFKG